MPAGAVQLNEACDWPRWQIAGGRVLGSGLILSGIVVFAYCSGLFSRVGKGTPVPLEPPEHLVIEGLYRFSRNPMYVAQVAYLLGLFVYRGELSLALYAAIFAGVIHTSVVRTEEPELRQRFGEEYVRYTKEGSALALDLAARPSLTGMSQRGGDPSGYFSRMRSQARTAARSCPGSGSWRVMGMIR